MDNKFVPLFEEFVENSDKNILWKNYGFSLLATDASNDDITISICKNDDNSRTDLIQFGKVQGDTSELEGNADTIVLHNTNNNDTLAGDLSKKFGNVKKDKQNGVYNAYIKFIKFIEDYEYSYILDKNEINEIISSIYNFICSNIDLNDLNKSETILLTNVSRFSEEYKQKASFNKNGGTQESVKRNKMKRIKDNNSALNLIFLKKILTNNKNANLSGFNFSNMDLSNMDFSGAVLNNVVFDGSNLSGSNFSNCDLSKSSFVSCDLTYADFSNTNCQDVNFQNASVEGVSFENSDLSYASFKNASFGKVNYSGSEKINSYSNDVLKPLNTNPKYNKMFNKMFIDPVSVTTDFKGAKIYNTLGLDLK